MSESPSPDSPEYWFELGTAHLRNGAADQAEAALRKALALAQQHPGYWNNLSVALHAQGRAAEAEASSRQALALDAAAPLPWVSLGNALYAQRRWSDAAAAYRESLARDPGAAATWSNLGAAEQKQENLAAAHEAYARSFALTPDQPSALINFAYLLAQRGEPQRAIELLEQSQPALATFPAAWVALGNAYRQVGDGAVAEAHYRRALELAPLHREARYRLALVLQLQWRLVEAEALARSLIQEDPAWADAWALLGGVLEALGRSTEGAAALQHSIELEPNPDRHSQYLLALQYVPEADPAELLSAHRRWDMLYAQPLSPAVHPRRTHAAQRPLRIGLVSADFGQHPTGYLVLPAIELLDKQLCQVVCYADRFADDDWTHRFRRAADLWRPTVGLTAAELAEQIRADEIDALIDLMGHVGKRLPVFARRPAPLQLTWFGYVGTTGLAAMDGLIADRFHVRPDEDAHYAERVLRMPHGYACYGPPDYAPDTSPLPALTAGHVTFGCFNNPAKYSPRLLDTWAAILSRVPSSRLLLKFGGLHQLEFAGRLRSEFARRGIDPERIVLEGDSPHAELLASYGRVDLALDTQPYSGGLTTCEALWMGVPVVTFPGKTFAGRHATSYLNNAGLQGFSASDAAGYVELAVQWSARLDELAGIRATLREQLRNSPVCDAPRFARDWLKLFHEAVR